MTSRLLALCALAALALSLPGAALAQLDDADDERPPIWSSRAGAAVIAAAFNTDPGLLPFDDFVMGNLADGQTHWDSTGRANARAADLWPGTTAVAGPGLICEAGMPCPDGFPPPYELVANAEHPTHPEAQSATGFSQARADGQTVETVSSVVPEALDALGDLVRVGAARSRIRHEFVDGVLEVRSVAQLQDVELLGGAVTMRSIDVRSVSRTDGDTVTEDGSRVSVAGVEVEGQPARITNDGIELVGQGDDGALLGGANEGLAQLSDGLSEAFTDFELDIRAVGVDHTTEPGSTEGHARGVQLSLRVPIDGPPLPLLSEQPVLSEFFANMPTLFPRFDLDTVYRTYTVDLMLGLASSQAYASTDAFLAGLPGALEGLVGSPPSSVDRPQASGVAPAPADIGHGPAPGLADSAAPGPDPDAPSAAGPSRQAEEQPGFELLGEDTAALVNALYLTMLLAVAGVFAFSRLQARMAGTE